MNTLPDELRETLTDRFGRVGEVYPLSGGDVNLAARVDTPQGRIFVKWKTGAPADLFALEADGLERLRAAAALRVPTVLAVGEAYPFLILEYLEPVRPRDDRLFARRLGEGLAALHKDNPALDGRFGLGMDNYLGSQRQVNSPHNSWPLFYRDCRLLPQIAKAQGRGLVPPSRRRLLEQVVERIEALLGGFEPCPVLIHGDLWSGNFIATAGEEPVLIDPAVYYAEREVEVAYTELFGGFPNGYLAAYHAAFPLTPGYERRRTLHQLSPLLVHLNHFGEAYGLAVDEACRQSFVET